MADQIREVIRHILGSQTLVALTGAGVSTDSGISDFRGKGGVYARWDRNRVFDLDYFHKDPAYFYRFAREELYRFDSIEPNVTHRLLAYLEEKGCLKTLITQNIDGLHQRAGNTSVLELHGGIARGHCLKCLKGYSAKEIKDKIDCFPVARCDQCEGLVKPDIVFFGEALDPEIIQRAMVSSETADLFLVMGSSLVVYPAAHLPEVAKRRGAILVIVDQQDTAHDDIADYKLEIPLKDFSKALYEAFSNTRIP